MILTLLRGFKSHPSHQIKASNDKVWCFLFYDEQKKLMGLELRRKLPVAICRKKTRLNNWDMKKISTKNRIKK